MPADLLTVDQAGLYCPLGDFHIDPWRPVPKAVITHAHGDHARAGSGQYWCAAPGFDVTKRRVGEDAAIEPVPYGEPFKLNAATVSLHPAGHILGSAQVRVEGDGQVWVVSGDYKRDADPTCAPFVPVKCDVFITEATFALPIYRWRPVTTIVAEIAAWWRENRDAGRASVLFCYALGKAQRILAELASPTLSPIFSSPSSLPTVYIHGSAAPLTDAYREAGIAMLPTERVADAVKRGDRERFAGELILAPPSAAGTPWMRRFGTQRQFDTAFASGWMRIRGIRRRRGYDRGFVISDHADWDDLLRTVEETGAKRVLATHGYSEALSRHLRSRGIESGVLPTPYKPEDED
jgi:putative mRNA 3-end processing factor